MLVTRAGGIVSSQGRSSTVQHSRTRGSSMLQRTATVVGSTVGAHGPSPKAMRGVVGSAIEAATLPGGSYGGAIAESEADRKVSEDAVHDDEVIECAPASATSSASSTPSSPSATAATWWPPSAEGAASACWAPRPSRRT